MSFSGRQKRSLHPHFVVSNLVPYYVSKPTKIPIFKRRVTCENCGNEFTRTSAKFKAAKYRGCSPACRGALQRKDSLIECNCVICNSVFEIPCWYFLEKVTCGKDECERKHRVYVHQYVEENGLRKIYHRSKSNVR